MRNGETKMAETNDNRREKDPRMVEAHEHLKAARQAMRKSFETLLPPGYLDHRRQARKEFLLAMRSLVDLAIDRVEKKVE
jgi:hypothetical protein